LVTVALLSKVPEIFWCFCWLWRYVNFQLVVCVSRYLGDETRVVGWGIVSAGLIANDFCLALRTLPPDEHQVGNVFSIW